MFSSNILISLLIFKLFIYRRPYKNYNWTILH